MPLTKLQKGAIGENEFEKLTILETDGALQVGRPLTDDDRRDREIYRRGMIRPGLAIQVKTTMVPLNSAHAISIEINVPRARLHSSRRFWYFLASFDRVTMGFREPVFLVPSEVIHRRADPRLHGDIWHFHFHASLDPAVHDAWRGYRVETKELGKRLLKALQASGKVRGRLMQQPLEPMAGLVYVTRRPGQVSATRPSPRGPRLSGNLN